MTVYKAVKVEADAAAAAAVALLNGEDRRPRPATVNDTETSREIPSVLATPVAIYMDDVKDVIADGFVTKDEVCTGPRHRVRGGRDHLIARRGACGAPIRAPRSLVRVGCATVATRRWAVYDGMSRTSDRHEWHRSSSCAASTRASARCTCCTTSTSRVYPGRSPRSSATTAPASRPSSSASPASTAIDSGEVRFDGQAGDDPRPRRTPPRSASRSCTRTSRCATTSTSCRTCSSAARRTKRALLDEARWRRWRARRSPALSVRTVKSVRQSVSSLSGGQRQTVAIAKAVLWNSKVVMLDEPTAALGVAQTEQVLELVRRLADQGLGVVIISHNMNDVFEVADRVCALYLGRVAAEVETKPTVARAARRADHRRAAPAIARPASTPRSRSESDVDDHHRTTHGAPTSPSTRAPASSARGAQLEPVARRGDLGRAARRAGARRARRPLHACWATVLHRRELRQPDRPGGAVMRARRSPSPSCCCSARSTSPPATPPACCGVSWPPGSDADGSSARRDARRLRRSALAIGLRHRLAGRPRRHPGFVVTLSFFLAWQGVLLQIAERGRHHPDRRTTSIVALVQQQHGPIAGWILWAVLVVGWLTVAMQSCARAGARALGWRRAAARSCAIRGAVVAVGVGLATYVLNQNRACNGPKGGVPMSGAGRRRRAHASSSASCCAARRGAVTSTPSAATPRRRGAPASTCSG